MATVRNVTDGALDVPALGRIVQPDELVECPNQVAAGFEGQPAWQIEYDPDRSDTFDDGLPVELPEGSN